MVIMKLFFSFFFLLSTTFKPGDLSGVVDAFNVVKTTAVSLVDGFAAQGGVVKANQIYSFQVFNNSNVVINPQVKKIAMIMGAPTDDGVGASCKLEPGGDSLETFHRTQLYFKIHIPEANFLESHCEEGYPNDTNMYYYNVYNDSKGTVRAELVGSNPKKVPFTSDFTGMIYNGSSTPFPLTFTLTSTAKGPTSTVSTVTLTRNITIPLESDVYHTLSSRDTMILRPSVFTYPGGKKAIAQEGFGITTSLTPTSTQITIAGPARYNYEVLPNNTFVQTGFAIGHYRQPVNGKLRSLNPVLYTVWNPTAADLGKDNAQRGDLIGLTSAATYSTWVIYTGSVYSIAQEKTINQPLIKVPTGKAISFYIIRPPVSRQKEVLYIFHVQSSDDASARSLLQEFFTVPIPRFTDTGLSFNSPTGLYNYTFPDGMNSNNLFTAFNTPLPDKVGLFMKKPSNAYILHQRTFHSYSAVITPFFCTVQPPSYSPTSILESMLHLFDQTKMTASIQKECMGLIPQWIDLLATDYNRLKVQLQNYLIQYGLSSLIDRSKKTPTLTPGGEIGLFMIINGPRGLSKMPLFYSTSGDTNFTAPTPWVDPKNVILY